MTSRAELLLLDTNILIHLIRGNSIGNRIVSEFHLREREHVPLISVVTVGELYAFARKCEWGQTKLEALETLVRQFVVVDIHSEKVLRNYAEVDAFLTKLGRPIEQNDMWIAATTMAAAAHLLTTDKDFDPLAQAHISRTWIDPKIQ